MGYSYYKDPIGFKGPYELNKETIIEVVGDHSGSYLLADSHFWGNKIKYVGRGKLKTRLKQRIGMYKYFYCKIANNHHTAFKLECREYHRYGKSNSLDNEIHPASPKTFGKKCAEIGCNGESH